MYYAEINLINILNHHNKGSKVIFLQLLHDLIHGLTSCQDSATMKSNSTKAQLCVPMLCNLKIHPSIVHLAKEAI